MRHIVCFPAILLAFVGLALAGGTKPKEDAEVALKGLDPVLLVKGKEVKGDKGVSLTHEGYRYSFSTAENRAAFEREPARYAIQLDGHCGVMPGIKGDPALFAVVRERIYVFGTANCRTAFTANPDSFLKQTPRKNVAVFLFEGVELLDFAGPSEVFAAAGRGRAFNVYTVAATEGDITSQGFLKIKPQYTIATCPKPDLIVLPGGNVRRSVQDEKVIAWVKKTAEEAEVAMSVCNGAFFLAKAGLLDGKEATTHWAAIDQLKREAPKTKVHSDRRFVDNGKVVTTAGVSAGIDGALHVVDRLLGRQAAKNTARYMEYRWEPDAKK